MTIYLYLYFLLYFSVFYSIWIIFFINSKYFFNKILNQDNNFKKETYFENLFCKALQENKVKFISEFVAINFVFAVMAAIITWTII